MTITKLKYATMTSLNTRQVKLHWLLQIYSSKQFITAINDLQQQQEIILRNTTIDYEK
jgi:hypothetical protein